jgi:hypothetical protein
MAYYVVKDGTVVSIERLKALAVNETKRTK